MKGSTLCIGADVDLNDIGLHLVGKGDGPKVIEGFRVTSNLPGAQAATTTIAQVVTRLGCTRIEIAWEATGML